MRDAQSLLEQLLSAGGQRLTVEVVHRLLGTASDERLLDLIDALADRDVAGALRQLDGAAGEGVQPADVLNGLLEFLRDVMVLATGAEATLLAATPRQVPRLQGRRRPLDPRLGARRLADPRRVAGEAPRQLALATARRAGLARRPAREPRRDRRPHQPPGLPGIGGRPALERRGGGCKKKVSGG